VNTIKLGKIIVTLKNETGREEKDKHRGEQWFDRRMETNVS